MSKITDEIIANEYIPHLIKEVYLVIKDEPKNEEWFVDFFTAFELQVKQKRERLKIGEISSN